MGRFNVVALIGSTRFYDSFMRVKKALTRKGNIVLIPPIFTKSVDCEYWTKFNQEDKTKFGEMLDEMGKQRIEMADEVFVINKNQYIGSNTKKEIDYANEKGKKVTFLEDTQGNMVI